MSKFKYKSWVGIASFAAGLFYVTSSLGAGVDNATLKGIQSYVKDNTKAQIALLNQLVEINSGTTNLKGVHQVGAVLEPEFQALGFKTYWAEEPVSMQRAGTLIAELPGKGPAILLIGHLDTVFPADSPFQHVTREGNDEKGPGVCDDKGGDVVILYALKALNAAHALEGKHIIVVLTGDEENSGKPSSISRKPLIDVAHNSAIALEFEGALTLNSVTIARRGIEDWTLTTTGKTGHSSGIFQARDGDGAIFEMARILDNFRTTFSKQAHLTVNPAIILGGTQVSFDDHDSDGTAAGRANVIAAKAIAQGDMRFMTDAQRVSTEKTMRQIVSQHLPITSATISFLAGIPAMPLSAGNQQLLAQYSQVSQLLGYGAVTADDPDARGASDISYVAGIVSANLAGLGPICHQPHSPDEKIDLHSISVETERTAVFILGWKG
ncbi:MAG: M20/M25/M40 family metallo-hydrolase [Gammaproteobacteria bacterium]|nr:M20/M25/M40 family metallo-hydrolase [Gammaproteobacteria bacterium]